VDTVSIIMKVWNALEHVKICLGRLLRNTVHPFELIIIDNGSEARVLAFLRDLDRSDSRVVLVENPTNLGPGRANRQGFSLARSNRVCLIDSDVLVPFGWLQRLVADFEELSHIRMLVPMKYHETVTYPFRRANSREMWFSVRQRHCHLSPLEQFYMYSSGLSIDEFDQAMRDANQAGIRILETPPAFTSTCCALLDGDFVEKVGGIADPVFEGYGSEDVDLCWRIGEGGGTVAKTTSVYVHHFHNSSMIDNDADTSKALRMANAILYDKWKSRLIEIVREAIPRSDDALGYLSSHFIFHPLSENTSLVDDLRATIGGLEIPARIPWEPRV
jgi:GT2 family glycosyltransferase